MFRAYGKLTKDSLPQGQENLQVLQFRQMLCLEKALLSRNTLAKKPKCSCTCVDTNGDGSCKLVCKAEKPRFQTLKCPLTSPPTYPPILQLPTPGNFVVRTDAIAFPGLPYDTCRITLSCPATLLLTGTNRSLAKDLAQYFFPRQAPPNVTENLSSLVLGSDNNIPYYNNELEAHLDDMSYIIQSQCPLNSTNVLSRFKCVRGICLWRKSSTVINKELFKGYIDGNQIVAAYDFLNTDKNNFNVSIWYNQTYGAKDADANPARGIPGFMNLVSNAYLEFLKGSGVKAELHIQQMPGFKAVSRDTSQEDLFILLNMFVVMNLFPVILTSLVYEKQQKLRIIMKMHGLGDASYWVVSYAYFFFLSLAYMLCYMVCGFFSGMGIFSKNDISIQILFYFIFFNLQIATAFLLSTVLSNVKMASVLGYLCTLGSGLAGVIFVRKCIEDKTFPRLLIFLMEVFPFFSLFRGLYDLMDSSVQEVGMRWEDMNDILNGMKEVLIVMCVEWCVFLFLTCYLDQVVSTGSGVKRHPLFFLQIFQKPRLQRQGSKVPFGTEKPDISQERKKVEQLLLNPSTGHTVICDRMEKIYPGVDGNPDKYAVRGFSLALPEGECFGMLGPNGAGKTSSISMMIGLTEPSSGTAYIQDLDIRTDMHKIYTIMGVCPQHDLLWESLTGREHLLFYGRLKNLTGSCLTQAVEETLSNFNLLNGGVGDKQAKQYSGGMKRRLSVAISLIGDPKVVYLDEPSTGLDPASRDLLWKVVKRAKKNRAIILTTHSMEKAEALCDRLGIFVDGKFRCIGNPKELKARYGGFYILTITTSSAHEEEAENSFFFFGLNQLSYKANRIYHIAGTQKYERPKSDIRIADVFQAGEQAKKKFPIHAWGISDTTLEDVFIKVAKEAQGT